MIYVGVGSHAAFPVGGTIDMHDITDGFVQRDSAERGVIPDILPDEEYMTHTGKVLNTQTDDSHDDLWESYNLVLLPDPEPSPSPRARRPASPSPRASSSGISTCTGSPRSPTRAHLSGLTTPDHRREHGGLRRLGRLPGADPALERADHRRRHGPHGPVHASREHVHPQGRDLAAGARDRSSAALLAQDVGGDGVGRAVHGDDHEAEALGEIASGVETGDVDGLAAVGMDRHLLHLEPVVVVLVHQARRPLEALQQ